MITTVLQVVIASTTFLKIVGLSTSFQVVVAKDVCKAEPLFSRDVSGEYLFAGQFIKAS
ncbi:MAG: hypothetical protein LBK00_10465 [Treponema sp.]|nr:hypothetical protein [Treponema sp.]